MSRLIHLDALRGWAIVTMVAANMTPYYLAEPHPAWLRLYGSFAAPLFVGITGYLAALQVAQGKSTRGRWLRGGLILLVAALVDIVIWQTWPFVAFDVLYVIGLASLVIPLAWRGGTGVLLLLTSVCVGAGLVLQRFPGYDSSLHVVKLSSSWEQINPQYVLEQLFITGYFPIFPWLGIAAAGGLLYRVQDRLEPIVERWGGMIVGPAIVLATGLCYLLANDASRATRSGYCELFYPPDALFLATAAVVCLLCVYCFRTTLGQWWQKPLAALGQSSLFFYLFHLLLIRLCSSLAKETMLNYLVWQAFFLTLMLLATIPIAQVRKLWPHRPLVLRMLIG